ncbi:hypothetical protein SAMN02745135_00831 [Caloranaerobacter azorensis DSM 13643]|uniref:Uncharacterized protein n=1 Tax=Caloranaerobacter azorensis DSM 13643 TaxID=1121264 RepID=A0A1M5T2A0_9FIRM|nr:hypothetical protein [Caloranaerobacter azorensis]SHH44867.1 hypothetical protein SAMN02745135_00831 [Caloranaerobacter azorensis DSM 13643]
MKKAKNNNLQSPEPIELKNIAEIKKQMGTLYTDITPEGYTNNANGKNTMPYTHTSSTINGDFYMNYPELFNFNYEIPTVHLFEYKR